VHNNYDLKVIIIKLDSLPEPGRVTRPPDDVTVDQTSASLSRLLGNVTSRGDLWRVDRLDAEAGKSVAVDAAGGVE